jgi:hypothetical protein
LDGVGQKDRRPGWLLPAGPYDVITHEKLIEGFSFASFRRVATIIVVPAADLHCSAMEMISIGSVDLSDAPLIGASVPND